MKRLIFLFGIVLCISHFVYADMADGWSTGTAGETFGGNVLIGGTLGVTGAATLSSTLDVTGEAGFDGRIVYQTDKYIVCDVFTSTGINACIDLLGAEGGEVYLPEGTYTCTTAITIDYASTTITGAGAGTILDFSAGQPTPSCIDTNDKDYVLIRNLKMLGKAGGAVTSNLIGDADTADYLIVENCFLYDSDQDGVTTGGDYVHINNNHIDNPDQYGIRGAGAVYAKIKTNHINSAGAHSIILDTSSKNSLVEGNITIGCALDSIQINDSDNSSIVNNICKTHGYNGIEIVLSDYCVINNNYVEDAVSGRNEMLLDRSDYCTVIGNQAYGDGTSDKGIYLDESDYCVVAANKTSGNDVAGIQEDSDCQNNLIYGNNCQDTIPYVINGTSPEHLYVSGNIGISSSAPNAQLAIKSNSAPTEWIVKVSSQDGTNILNVTGDGAVAIAGTLGVTDVATFTAGITSTGEFIVVDGSSVIVGADTVGFSILDGVGDLGLDDDLEVIDDALIGGDLDVVGDLTVDANVHVLIDVLIDGDLDVVQDIDADSIIISDDLTVTGVFDCIDGSGVVVGANTTGFFTLDGVGDLGVKGELEVLDNITTTGDIGISSTTPIAQLSITSDKAPTEYIVKIASQNGANILSIDGSGAIYSNVSYACGYSRDTVVAVTGSTSTFVILDATWISEVTSNGFTISGASATYNGGGGSPKVFKISGAFSAISDTANTVVYWAIFKNGVLYESSIINRKIAVAADVGAMAISSLIELSTDDILDVRLAGDKSANVTNNFVQFDIIQIN